MCNECLWAEKINEREEGGRGEKEGTVSLAHAGVTLWTVLSMQLLKEHFGVSCNDNSQGSFSLSGQILLPHSGGKVNKALAGGPVP